VGTCSFLPFQARSSKFRVHFEEEVCIKCEADLCVLCHNGIVRSVEGTKDDEYPSYTSTTFVSFS
jgi:hypothetical protein